VAVDRLVKKGLVARKERTNDRRVRQVEDAVNALSERERLTLLRLLKKLGKHAAKS